MGTDIEVDVEIRQNGTWRPVDVDASVNRDYDLFGCLFGVRNFARFEPLFADRGLPDDVSDSIRERVVAFAADGTAHGVTWVGCWELAAIDLEEPALNDDERIHEFEVDADGTERLVSKSVWSTRDLRKLRRDGELRRGSRIFRRVRMVRGDALGASFEQFESCLRHFTVEHGEENVRAIVSFVS